MKTSIRVEFVRNVGMGKDGKEIVRLKGTVMTGVVIKEDLDALVILWNNEVFEVFVPIKVRVNGVRKYQSLISYDQ